MKGVVMLAGVQSRRVLLSGSGQAGRTVSEPVALAQFLGFGLWIEKVVPISSIR
jgi:hypothetical protein